MNKRKSHAIIDSTASSIVSLCSSFSSRSKSITEISKHHPWRRTWITLPRTASFNVNVVSSDNLSVKWSVVQRRRSIQTSYLSSSDQLLPSPNSLPPPSPPPITMPSPILPISDPQKQLRPPPAMLPLIVSKDGDDPVGRILISNYDDEKMLMDRPLLPRTSSFTYSSAADSPPPAVNGGGGFSKQYQQRRRRVNSESCLSSLTSNGRCGNGELIGGEVEDDAKEMRLSLKLFRFLGLGYRFAKRIIALGCYSMLLWPGFIQVGYYYFFSNQVRRGIVYGSRPRNRLDLYLPKDMDGPKPVIAFITGGAWIIGYKAWGSLLGQQLTERGIIVACIDYRNFPQGTISDMITDASQGISFVCNNISEYGGDPNRIYVMGQSAGAHIAACTLLEQAIKESSEEQSCSWRLSQVKAYFGLSGGYNLLNLVDHFDNRGLYRSIFLGIMEGEESLRRYSPELMAQDPNIRAAVARLPPFVLFHGTADYSIPPNASKDFAESLQRAGVKAEAILYEGKTHTDLFLQDPMRGGKDDMVEELVSRIHGDDEEALKKDAMAPSRRRMVPEFMLKLARAVSPF